MHDNLRVLIPVGALVPYVGDALDHDAVSFAAASKAEATRLAYALVWRDFVVWYEAQALDFLGAIE